MSEIRSEEDIMLNRTPSADENIRLVRRLLDGMLELNGVNVLEQFLAKTICVHGPMSGYVGEHEQSIVKEFDSWLAKAFKKHKMDVEEIFAHEDKVVVYWTVRGTRRDGAKEIVISGISIYRIKQEKISEIWHSWDRLGLLEQLGEVRVSSSLSDLESNYDTLKGLGMEKYSQQASRLSNRERQCLKHLIDGKTAKETASALKLSHRTVEYYFENIKGKLVCWNKRDLLATAQILERLELL